MKLEEDKRSIGSFLRASFSSKKNSKKHSKPLKSSSSSASSSASSTASSNSISDISSAEFNGIENSDVFFGEGMSIINANSTNNYINAEKSKILEVREASSTTTPSPTSSFKGKKSSFTTKKTSESSEDAEKLDTVPASSSTNYFTQLSQKFEARPRIQKLGEKIRTLISSKEHQHYAHFRRLFASCIPDGDNLIMTFPCSYSAKFKDVPLHGRMYLTLSMIGFSSSLFGYEKKIIIPLRDIASLKKGRTSRFLINSIKILTQSGDKHSFGSLKSCDRTYSLLFRVLRMNADPNIRDSMIEDDDDELDQLKAGSGDGQSVGEYRIDSNLMTASDTSSEGSDENNSFTSSTSNRASSEWPAAVESITPVIPVECPCREHKGRKLIDIEIPLNVQQTFDLLFSDNEWLTKFEESLKRSERKSSSWIEEGSITGKKERVCIYTLELDKTFGPKFTKITETQNCNPIVSFNEGFILVKEATNEGIPYADSFSVECIYCVTKVSETKSRLKVHGGVTFKKYIFGLIKGVIERSTVTGLDSYYNALIQRLKADEDKLLSYVTEMEIEEPIIAEETLLNENAVITMNNLDTFSSATPSNGTCNRLADRVVSMSNLKEANVIPPTSSPHHDSRTSEAQTIVLLLKIIAVLLLLLLLSNLWFNFSSRPQPLIIPSGPSSQSLEELQQLRNMVNSLESKFNSFITGAKKEL